MSAQAGNPASLESLFASLRNQASNTSDGGADAGRAPAHGTPAPFQFFGSGPHSRSSSAYNQQMHPPGPHQATVSSPIPDPDPRGPQPHHPSAVVSPNVPTPNTTSSPAPGGGQQPNADRTANLLNLLKFNQSGSATSSPAPRPSQEESGHQNASGQGNPNANISASDLVASFMGKPAAPSTSRTPSYSSVAPSKPEVSRDFAESTPSPSAHTQEFLLKLLNRPKASPTEPSSSFQAEKFLTTEQRQAAADQAESREEAAPVPSQNIKSPAAAAPSGDGQVPSQNAGQSIFTYVNPFEQLAASSPRNRTPKHGTPHSGRATPDVDTLRSSKPSQAAPSTMESRARPSRGSPAPRRISPQGRTPAVAHEAPSALSSPPPAPLPDGRSQMEALLGIGTDHKDPETVAEALTEVGENVDRQVEKALADVDARSGDPKPATDEKNGVYEELDEDVKEAAADVKEELDRSENKGVLEETLPKPVAAAVKDLIDGAAQANEADPWESADDGEADAGDTSSGRVVRVYNFPMRPFSTLAILQLKWPNPAFREDAMMEIARLKKDFDQIDRTLVTATKDFIVYGMAKNGGFRVIRQDDGSDKHVFGSTKDRIFTVAAATASTNSSSAGVQAVLATGVSGTVYWLPLCRNNEDIFDNEEIERHAIVFPPTSSQDESTSGGQLKTRARKSCRHPEFFAVGRGKSIHIVWPSIAGSADYLANRKDRTVDTQKYLQERCLKIATGKAGKDFTFSEDDSVIASLDKLGRLRFWDVRDLTDESNAVTFGTMPPIEIKTPILTFVTTSPAEKAWPSSVTFVDKPRPYARASALRYMLLGMKQNHTLQLWDLALRRAVQELHLPHTNESDAICSVAYHHASNIIVVSHPTRNSIYFLHLSAPRYNISPMSQARFLERIAQKDPSLPKPDVTAIMSGFREYSVPKGQLRSIDILPQPSAAADDLDNPVLFELYVMHSKGVSCLSINREDMGWSKDNKIVHAVDAEDRGVISVKELREIPAASSEQSSTFHVDQPSTASASTASLPPSGKISKKGPSTEDSTAAIIDRAKKEEKADTAQAATLNGSRDAPTSGQEKQEKQEKRKKKRAGGEAAARGNEEQMPSSAQLFTSEQAVQPPKAVAAQAPATSNKPSAQSKPQKAQMTAPAPNGESADQVAHAQSRATVSDSSTAVPSAVSQSLDQEIKKIEKSISAEFKKVISGELGTLYRRFDEDKRIQQAAGDAKQDAILRLVSSTLSENVEKSLARMIGQNIQQSVIPAIVETTSTNLSRNVSDAIRSNFHSSFSRELKSVLPETIGRAFQSPDVLRSVSDLVADKVAVHVESEFSSVLHGTITPAFKQLALDSAQKMAGEVQRRTGEQIKIADLERQNDSHKIDQLHELVRGLSQTVSKMAEAQSDFQGEILKLQRQLQVQQGDARQRATSESSGQERGGMSRQSFRSTPRKDPRLEEQEKIVGLMREDRFEEATIMWLQSNQQEELFDNVFVHCDPSVLQSLSPLVLLSVAASITSSLENNVRERLDWLNAGFSAINPADTEVHGVLPKIMDVLVGRLEALYMRIAESNHQDPLLRKIPSLTRIAKQLKIAGSDTGRLSEQGSSSDQTRMGL